MNAKLSNLRISPRKVRIVADLVRGKTMNQIDTMLSYLPKKSSDPILKLVKSAFSNAKAQNSNIDPEKTIVKSIMVDKGLTMKRFMPRAFGSATPIRKKSSHVIVVLGEKSEKTKNNKEKIMIKKDTETTAENISVSAENKKSKSLSKKTKVSKK